jgi:transglutaminase-like putative cysteine protease
MQPLSDSSQTCLDFQLQVDPIATIRSYETIWGTVKFFQISPPHSRLIVSVGSMVETRPGPSLDDLSTSCDDWSFYGQEAVRMGSAEYLAPTRLVLNEPEAIQIATVARAESGTTPSAFLLSINRILNAFLAYDPDATHVHTTLRDVVAERRGVCQDFAHLMLAVCRSQGIPSRYVSGYHFVEPGVLTTNGDEAMHAWVECLLPDGRWYGFDPTNNSMADQQYVKVFYGRDYSDASPLRGIYHGQPEDTMEVRVHVQREQAETAGQA